MSLNVILCAVAVPLLLILSFAAYFRWQSAIKPAPYEVMFEVRELDPNGGQSLQAEKRFIALEGALNFRDLGGYKTADGRCVAWGKVYRSGELCRLTDGDSAVLRQLGVKLVCDLRSDREVAENPDCVPEGVAYRRLPVYTGDPISVRELMFMRHRLDAVMRDFYTRSILDRGASVLGDVLRLAANPDHLPMVFHCASGKDRAGMAAALLLRICGVPRDLIVVDYSLTNLSIESMIAHLRESVKGAPPWLGVSIEQFYPIFSARPELIEQAFAHIEATYGSIDAYLRGPVGLTDSDIDAIRRNLLV